MSADHPAPPTTAADDPGGRTARRLVVTVVLAAVVPVVYLLGTPHNFFDLKIYMKAMRFWADGHPLYDYAQPDRVQGELYFTYPPFSALLLRPFADLRLGVTVAIFTILTSLAVVVTTWWLVKPIADRRGIPRWFAAGVAIPLVFAAESTRETITFGQINMLLVVLILADLLFAVPRNSRWAGVGIGLATALKLFPGIFIIYLLAARRWREAVVASATAAVATLLAAAVAPGDSWRFWTHELWSTDRVGRTDYTGNQSLYGLLSRFTVPEKPDQLLWLSLVAVIGGYGLWRASRAARGGDGLAGLALTGLVGSLVSPISWTHHVYWFIPAVLVLADASVASPSGWEPAGTSRRHRRTLLVLAVVVYGSVVYGVVSFHDWGSAPQPTDSPVEFVLRNMYVLLAVVLLLVLPTRHLVRTAPASSSSRSGVPVTH
ncbi:glycosyltransferase family 87 protein [Micromonospora sp. NPDC050417]|uniref:glycosyltransferase family 87 protein n=1 Tax=Micromonospora sp. NPDC050417 TaxID=3364280 RepID=UPI00379BE18B